MSQSSPQPERSSPHRPQDRRQELHPDRPVAEPTEVTAASDTAGAPDAVRAPDRVRASDAEREAVVERLRIASVEGRLTFEELTERTEAAYAAVTRGDLDAITADLPGMGAPGAEPAPLQVKRRFSAVMGDCKERIVGRIDGPLEAVSVMGDVELDLRGAQVPSGEVTVTATAVMGDVKIIVPDGVRVEVTGHNFLGDRRIAVREPHPGARVPVVRVNATVVMGDVKIVDDEHHAPLRRAIADRWRDRT
ncbi:cell wall-active antibiotic response 4TMS protein YvqF [Actinomadura pelletieri DSM 43383]|uniref:Cell wall-active antibiotic response 4TMS protein YvqF n=1 Tax=Actinomadura pelletieri DSM 43383 TaxID=1120940 RepID=A0A495QBE2_9ACTN|nr:DUF1707 domain-containing protein [Actinomadura pelletieri]RKS68917.1 cell wall-active antibiotic response 4TMS protein YvqF [Actinomadura pelletieri DSM 43383]